MFSEVLAYFFTQAPVWAKRRGLLYESIAIGSRFKRQKRAWSEHLQNSQQEVRKFLKNKPHIQKVLVLGSGHLLDFPTELFQDPQFSKWGLVDAIHPRVVQKMTTRKFNHIDLLQMDLVHISKNDLMGWDAIISCCLASQLPLSVTEETHRSREIVEQHFSLLRGAGLPFLIITDFERHFQYRKETLAESRIESSIFEAKLLSEPSRTWIWNLAPQGEISKDYSLKLNVGVWTGPSPG